VIKKVSATAQTGKAIMKKVLVTMWLGIVRILHILFLDWEFSLLGG
jgi:hypothetical protein